MNDMPDPRRSPVSRAPTLRIEHTFAAPRERVFAAWTQPELLARWFAPRGCTVHFARLEVRPGGRFHCRIHDPTFGDCWTIGEYREVVAPERLVFTLCTADANGRAVSPQSQGHDRDWPAATVVAVTFTECDGGTRVTLEQDVDEALAKRTGAHPSWLQMLERLAEQVCTTSPATRRAHDGAV